MNEPYPLAHWADRMQEVDPKVLEAVAAAVSGVGANADVAVEPLAGAGNHKVFGLRFAGRDYCLKQPTPTKRHKGMPELVLRREVGGLCALADRLPGICPRPLAWNTDPTWLLMEMLPGNHLGNTALTQSQLTALADAYKEFYGLRPQTAGEALWDIDWDVRFMVQWMVDHRAALADAGQKDGAAAEAAALMGEWLDSPDPARFLEDSDCLVFARGDQNMANAIWDGDRVRFVDMEYCGWSDIARDLSLVTDHIRSYETPVEGWDFFLSQFDLSASQRRRLLAGRRRQALSWLAKECLRPGSLLGVPRGDGQGGRVEVLLDRARALSAKTV